MQIIKVQTLEEVENLGKLSKERGETNCGTTRSLTQLITREELSDLQKKVSNGEITSASICKALPCN